MSSASGRDRETMVRAERDRARDLDQPHPARLAPDHPYRSEILAAHAVALEHHHDGYIDPVSGLFVLTAEYLARRGTCCNSGCRHCPYVL